MTGRDTPPPDTGANDAPPLPVGWGALYALVIVALAAAIAALWWLTERFR